MSIEVQADAAPSSRYVVVVAAIIVFYYIVIAIFARNFPISDDFWLIDWLNRFADGEMTNDFLRQLISQHNEHRIATTRLIYLFDYSLFGELNFRRLILVGNLFLLGIFWLLARHLPALPGSRSLLPFVACLTFQFSTAESIFWSITAISNHLVVLLAVITFALTARTGVLNLLLVIGCGVLAALTQGNGLAVPFIAVACFAWGRRWGDAALALLAALLIACWYFHDFGGEHGRSFDIVSTTPGDFVAACARRLLFALAFSGSAFGIGGSHYPVLTTVSLLPTVCAGIFIWAWTLYELYRRWTQAGSFADGARTDLFLALNVFVIATAVAAAVARTDFGFGQSMMSRYHLYSLLAVIGTAALVLEHLAAGARRVVVERSITWLSALAAMYLVASLAFVAYFCFGVYGPVRAGGIVFDDIDRAHAILERAQQFGVFTAR